MARIRIKDIAEIAHVSVGTVDRVIHNRGEVSEATRERVLKLLKEHNYTPDLHASTLAWKRNIHLAVLMPGPVNEHVFWKMPQQGIEDALKELSSYRVKTDILYFDQQDPGDFEQKVADFPFHKLQGILFAPVFREESLQFLHQCEKTKVPVVLFNSLLEVPSVRCFVGQDAYRSGYVAGKLINYGMEPMRDVVIVNMSSRKDQYAHIIQREKGFRNYFEDHSGRLNHLAGMDLNSMEDRVLADKLDEAFHTYDISGLFVTSSRVHRVARYLSDRGQMNVRLVGYDLLPESVEYLKRDYIDFLISQSPQKQAARGLTCLFNLVAFHREPEPRQFMPIDIITRENLIYYQPS